VKASIESARDGLLFTWVTVVYDDASMTDDHIVGIDWINDGGPRLANNYPIS
jgi:hypothetical protein